MQSSIPTPPMSAYICGLHPSPAKPTAHKSDPNLCKAMTPANRNARGEENA